MNNIKKKTITAFVLVSSLISCQKEVAEVNVKVANGIQFVANIEDTKVAFDKVVEPGTPWTEPEREVARSYTKKWLSNDEVAVMMVEVGTSGASYQYDECGVTIDEQNPGCAKFTAPNFVCHDNTAAWMFGALTPASQLVDFDFDYNEQVVSITVGLPAEQHPVDGSPDPKAIILSTNDFTPYYVLPKAVELSFLEKNTMTKFYHVSLAGLPADAESDYVEVVFEDEGHVFYDPAAGTMTETVYMAHERAQAFDYEDDATNTLRVYTEKLTNKNDLWFATLCTTSTYDRKITFNVHAKAGDVFSKSIRTPHQFLHSGEIAHFTVNFASEEPDPNILPGEFSVSATKKVQFSKGNLYWDGSAFKFEEHQYDYPTTYDASHVGHFYWTDADNVMEAYAKLGTSGDIANATIFTNKTYESANLNFKVNDVTGVYRSLSNDEWTYLLNRENSYTVGIRYCGINGMVLYPDTYASSPLSGDVDTLPEDVVFLPFAGYRGSPDGSGNTIYEGDEVFIPGSVGINWTSTGYSTSMAYFVVFGIDDESAGGMVQYGDYTYRYLYAYSIRLVKDVK